ncbi:ycf3-interacting protein, chloroplastic [Raphidocelis subcapitata]|uniref:Ycf3-interacting protein, chloroplastic n=1 Tax=Raphidocelis subcapitata TaxID=307507 RepID=A0A2V0NK93_9CHLO|nr:ycf3-interacting protein, chloroplastic [Raphidocelis subcapitata]|eukprot:GBF87399.1 ycf3-interacting protein, chloroplastic [Raphidocelis subcapitata]
MQSALSRSARAPACARRGARQQQPQRRAPPLPAGARRRPACAASGGDAAAAAAKKEEDLEAMVERFMQQQAEKESGAAFARTLELPGVVGSDLVADEDAKALCREVVAYLRTLKTTRDMSAAETKLTVAIESPEAREARKMGVEDSRGVSRDEMAAALDDVSSGRIPKDRLALKCLVEEMRTWPDLAGTV